MRSDLLQTLLLWGIAVCLAVWTGVVTPESLGWLLLVLVVWSLCSTLLVATAAAWIWLGREYRRSRAYARATRG